MKMIVAVIRPELLSCLQLPIQKFDIESMTVTETHDYSATDEHTLIYRSSEIRVRSSPKVRLEVIVNDIDADDLVEAIADAAIPVRKGLRSDCKVFVVSLENYLHVSDAAKARLTMAHSH